MSVVSEKLKRHLLHRPSLDNKDRWMVSYADFVTLLFGFFLTMYALSSVNEGRYRVLAQSIAAAFANQKLVVKDTQAIVKKTEIDIDDVLIKRMGGEIATAMTPWIGQGLIKVNVSPVMLQIDINASALFASGSSDISNDASPILQALANILSNFPNAIHVEGFTDNRPINTAAFPSNWELSAARAATVVRMFGDIGIEPTRMASVGYGQFHPIADNDTSEGRSRNRRVVIVVLSGNDPRSFIDVVQTQNLSNKDVVRSSDAKELNGSATDLAAPASDKNVPLQAGDEINEVFSIGEIEGEEIPL